MDRNKAYKYFHALLGELGIRDRKADILSGYGVESTAELTDGQLQGLINTLEDEKRRRTAEREAGYFGCSPISEYITSSPANRKRLAGGG